MFNCYTIRILGIFIQTKKLWVHNIPQQQLHPILHISVWISIQVQRQNDFFASWTNHTYDETGHSVSFYLSTDVGFAVMVGRLPVSSRSLSNRMIRRIRSHRRSRGAPPRSPDDISATHPAAAVAEAPLREMMSVSEEATAGPIMTYSRRYEHA